MSKREDDQVVASKISGDSHQSGSKCSGWPDPEEGYRLMRAFLGIRRPALRQAIVELVTELSAPGEDPA